MRYRNYSLKYFKQFLDPLNWQCHWLLLCSIWGAKWAIQHKNGLIILLAIHILYVVFNIVLITAVATCTDTENKQKLLKMREK